MEEEQLKVVDIPPEKKSLLDRLNLDAYLILLIILLGFVAYLSVFKHHIYDDIQLPKDTHLELTCEWQSCKGLQPGQTIAEENCTTGYQCVQWDFKIMRNGFNHS